MCPSHCLTSRPCLVLAALRCKTSLTVQVFFHLAKAHFKGYFFSFTSRMFGRSLPNVVVPRVTAGKLTCSLPGGRVLFKHEATSTCKFGRLDDAIRMAVTRLCFDMPK